MQEQKIYGRREGQVSHVVFNNPAKLNAVSLDMWDGLLDLMKDYENDPKVRCVVVSGAGLVLANGTDTLAVASSATGFTLPTAVAQGAAYTVTVAATLKDTLGKGIDVTANTANFLGYLVPAVVRLNELNGNISGHDLVELRVMTAGNTLGITLEEDILAKVTTLRNQGKSLKDVLAANLTAP